MTEPVSIREAPRRRSPALHPFAVVLYGIALVLAMLSPPVDHLADTSRPFHYAQHAVFMIAGGLVGAGLLNRRAWSVAAVHRALALGALGLACELAMVLSWADSLADRDPTFHQTQHGVIFLGGVLLGNAIVSLQQMRR